VHGVCIVCRALTLDVKHLPTDSRKQRIGLESTVLIHNYRTEGVGSYQIKTVFDPECIWIIRIDGYDRISKFYLQPEDFEWNYNENDYEL